MLARLTNWNTVIVLVVLILPFNVFIFPARSAKLRELAGKNVPTVDSMFAYTPTQVYDVISDYGEQGRQHHAVTELTADLVYPILYSLLLGLLLALIVRQAFSSTSFLQKLWLLPFIAALTDFGENATIVTLLLRYPQRLTGIAWAGSLFTSAKWVLVSISFILIVIGLVALLVKRMTLEKGAK